MFFWLQNPRKQLLPISPILLTLHKQDTVIPQDLSSSLVLGVMLCSLRRHLCIRAWRNYLFPAGRDVLHFCPKTGLAVTERGAHAVTHRWRTVLITRRQSKDKQRAACTASPISPPSLLSSQLQLSLGTSQRIQLPRKWKGVNQKIKHPAAGSLANMKMLWVLLLALSSVPGAPAVPAQRHACHKRPLREHSCHSVPAGTDSLRHVHDALPHHFWEGKGCQVICYCNLNELLCCPKDIFFGPKISFVIPCNS